MRPTPRRTARLLTFAITALASLASMPAVATNGYFAHGYSAAQRALGGSGTASSEDALIATINPAGIARVGNRWDANLSLFVPKRGYEVEAGNVGLGIVNLDAGRVDSEHDLFGIPGFGLVRQLGDRTSFGLAVYGNGGMNSTYKFDEGGASFFTNPVPILGAGIESRCSGSFGGGAPKAGNGDTLGFCGNGRGTASVDLIQLFIAPSFAYRLGEHTSIGITPIIAAQRFQATGLQAFAQFSNSPDNVSDNGFDFSFGGGGRVGLLTQVLPGVDFGVSWQSRIYMSRFKKYEGLFAEQGDFDIPPSWNVGLALKPTANQRIFLDYQRINFSDVASVGNAFGPGSFVNNCAVQRLLGSTAASEGCLGADGGPGFGWRDVEVYKIGYQLRQGDWTWRLGYSQPREQPIPETELLFNILAPAVVEKHYTAGVSWQSSPRLGFDLSLMYAPANPVSGRNPLSNVQLLSGGSLIRADEDDRDQRITIDMHQYELTFGVNYTY